MDKYLESLIELQNVLKQQELLVIERPEPTTIQWWGVWYGLHRKIVKKINRLGSSSMELLTNKPVSEFINEAED